MRRTLALMPAVVWFAVLSLSAVTPPANDPYITPFAAQSELTYLVDANQIEIEHRFFPVYHRFFYPDDVDATVPYVAPSGRHLQGRHGGPRFDERRLHGLLAFPREDVPRTMHRSTSRKSSTHHSCAVSNNG